VLVDEAGGPDPDGHPFPCLRAVRVRGSRPRDFRNGRVEPPALTADYHQPPGAACCRGSCASSGRSSSPRSWRLGAVRCDVRWRTIVSRDWRRRVCTDRAGNTHRTWRSGLAADADGTCSNAASPAAVMPPVRKGRFAIVAIRAGGFGHHGSRRSQCPRGPMGPTSSCRGH
jgi:hypothetical protein